MPIDNRIIANIQPFCTARYENNLTVANSTTK